MRRYLLIGAVAAMLAIPALAFGRATTTITIGATSNTFGPKTVTKTVGTGSIHWRWGTNGTTFSAHNIRQDDKLFYSGSLTANNPAGYTLVPSAGGFHYYCELHGFANGGMAGTIKVRPAVFNKTATSFGVRWSTGSDDTGDAYDARYRVDGGAWKTWKNDVTATQAVFGANNKPVHVGPGHTYEIQVRSVKKSQPSKQSDWSPSARVTT